MKRKNFVKADEDDEGLNFAAGSPKGAVVEEGGAAETSRLQGVPAERMQEMRDIKDTDPHVNEAVNTIIDWTCGDGFNISPRNIKKVETDTQSETERLRELFATSGFWTEMVLWVEHAATDGTAFMELVVEDEQFKPRVLPSKKVVKQMDEFGRVEEYGLLPPDENSPGGAVSEMPEDAETYEPHEIAELKFVWRRPEAFGRSLIEPIHEQADILRDMEIDYARFIATKAYPPILWTCGTEDEKWTEEQIDGWLETVGTIEPDSMIAAPHDVDHDVVGTTSTMTQTGALRLEETFVHFEERIVTGLGVPSIIMNMQDGRREVEAIMPDFKRRISKLQNIVKNAIENQIFTSLLEESAEMENPIVPEFGFGQHSSAEKRLEIDKLIKLFNNGFLSREAVAERVGIDPETELPQEGELDEVVDLIQTLAGSGDNIQNPDGGSPSETGGGADSAGEEVTSRDDPENVDEDSRPRQAPTEDEDV